MRRILPHCGGNNRERRTQRMVRTTHPLRRSRRDYRGSPTPSRVGRMARPRSRGVPAPARHRRRQREHQTRTRHRHCQRRRHPHRRRNALLRLRLACRTPSRLGTRGEHRHRRLPPTPRRGPVRHPHHPPPHPPRNPRQGRIPRDPLHRARGGNGHRVGAPRPHPGARHLGAVRDAGDAAQHRALRERLVRRHGNRLRTALPVARDDAHGPGAGVAGTDLLHRRRRGAPRPAPDDGRTGSARPLHRLRRKRVRDRHR